MARKSKQQPLNRLRWLLPTELQPGAPKPSEVRHGGWFVCDYNGTPRWTNGATLHLQDRKPLVRLYSKDVLKRPQSDASRVTIPANPQPLKLVGICEGPHYRAALFTRPDGRIVQIAEAYVRYWRRLGAVEFVGAVDIYAPIGVQLDGQPVGLVMGLSPDPRLETVDDLRRYLPVT